MTKTHAAGMALSRRALLRNTVSGAAAAAIGMPFVPMTARGQAPQLNTVKPSVLTAACTGDMPLTSVKDGKPIGTDLEMLALIADRLALKLEVQLTSFPAVIETVQSGRADWFGGNFAWTPARAKILLLTDAVFYTSHYAIMRADEPFDKGITVANFKGRTIGTGTGFSIVPDMKKVPDVAEVKLYDSIDSCLRDIVAGRLDFGFLDAPVIDYMIQQNANWKLKQIPLIPDDGFPTLTRKNNAIWATYSANPDLFDAINQGVRWLWASNQVGPILVKYGIKSPDYLAPASPNPRLGVDRDEKGNIIGAFGHTPRDFSSVFK